MMTLNEKELNWLTKHSADPEDLSYEVVSDNADDWVVKNSTDEMKYSWNDKGEYSLLDCTSWNGIPDDYNVIKLGNKAINVYSELVDID